MEDSPRRARGAVALTAGAVLLGVFCTLWSHRSPGVQADAGCLSCHRGIETASASHEGCVSCHGGNPDGKTKDAAHAGIYGIANPSFAGRWELGCKPCHRHQVERVNSNQMFTNTGMIGQIQATWEGERAGVTYASPAGETHALDGTPVKHVSVGQLDNLSGDLYRKFCSRCHVARQNEALDGNGHPAGCAACHFPYGERAIYRGGDPTMKGKSPHSETHAMKGLPPMEACLACHQRSGRHALSYQGLMDGNNGLVPTKAGGPGPLRASDGRNFTHVAADVHFLAGMECIDCHTSREVMGEGYAAPDMRGQLEIRCEDCHGDGERSPSFVTVGRESDLPLRESRQYGRPVRPGDRVALTGKGRPYSNVFAEGGEVLVATKRTGKLLRSKVVTGTPRAPHRGARADGVLGLPLAHRGAVLRLPHAVRQARHRVGLHPGEGDRGRVERDGGPPPSLPVPARGERPREDLPGDAGLPDVHQRDRGRRHAVEDGVRGHSTRASRSCASPPSTATTPASAPSAAPSATATRLSSASAST